MRAALLGLFLTAGCYAPANVRVEPYQRAFYRGHPDRAARHARSAGWTTRAAGPDEDVLRLELASALVAAGRDADAAALLVEADDELETLDYSSVPLGDAGRVDPLARAQALPRHALRAPAGQRAGAAGLPRGGRRWRTPRWRRAARASCCCSRACPTTSATPRCWSGRGRRGAAARRRPRRGGRRLPRRARTARGDAAPLGRVDALQSPCPPRARARCWWWCRTAASRCARRPSCASGCSTPCAACSSRRWWRAPAATRASRWRWTSVLAGVPVPLLDVGSQALRRYDGRAAAPAGRRAGGRRPARLRLRRRAQRASPSDHDQDRRHDARHLGRPGRLPDGRAAGRGAARRHALLDAAARGVPRAARAAACPARTAWP